MLPYLVLGLFAGAIYALSSLGIVLTYKTTGIFNFAYGGVAMFCAYVFWQLRDEWGISQWLSIPILLLVVAPLVGLSLEAVFRSLSAVASEVQIVVSLGMLAFFTTLVPILFGGDSHHLPTIFSHTKYAITDDVVVTGHQVGTLLLSGALAAALYVLLHRTKLGTATRAVVDNEDLAGLIAVNARTVSRAAWILSTMFAAVAGVLLSTQEGLVTYVLPLLVIYSFAPALLGRLTSLPMAFLGATLLGIATNVLAKYGSSGFISKLVASLPYLALFLVLVIYGKRLTEVRSSVRQNRPGRLPSHSRRIPAAGVGALALVVIVLPQAFGASTVHSVAQAMAYTVVAITVVVLTGWTGQISIAQMSFAGLGAFTTAHVAGSHPGYYWLGILAAVAIAVPVSLLIGLPSLRLTGLFLALATMAFALVMDTLVFTSDSITGGSTGLTLSAASIGPITFNSDNAQLYLCATVLALTGVGAYWLRKGPVGRRLQMVRDSPAAASTLGASLTATKLAVFAACAAVSAIGGSLLALTQETVVPSNFSFNISLALLLAVVLGGRSLISGAIFAGLIELIALLPVPTTVNKYLPLGVALSVIMIAREPDGLIRVTLNQLRYISDILYRLGRRPTAAPRVPQPEQELVLNV